MKMEEFIQKIEKAKGYEDPPENTEPWYPSLDDLEEVLPDDLRPYKDFILYLTLKDDEELSLEGKEVKEAFTKILKPLYGLENSPKK